MFSVLLRTIAWETASQVALRSRSNEVREEPVCVCVFIYIYMQSGERLLLVARIRYLNFSAFLCMGRCKNLGSLEFFLRYAFFTI